MSEKMNVAAEGAAESAQTSAASAQTVIAEDGQNGNVSDATFADTAVDGEGTPSNDGKTESGEGEGKKPQSKSTNAEYARKRREAERAREIEDVRKKAIIEALDGKNPYTGRPMQDGDDVAEFLAMREIEKKGGDPVTDFSEHQKAKAREKRRVQEEREQEEAWFKNDRAAFSEKYPDVSLDELIADEDFADYADGKVGKKPLAEIYEGFLRQSARFEERARTRAAQMVANGKASPGALSAPAQVESDFFTRDQVRAMTPAQIDANYDKIRKSMSKW